MVELGNLKRYFFKELCMPHLTMALIGLLAVSAPIHRGGRPTQQAPTPSREQQIAAAVLPLPAAMRAGATVLGYPGGAALVELRKGTNKMICLADNPALPPFHTACYHESLEPFMARGRALRVSGVAADKVDSMRNAEVMSGAVTMSKGAAALYTLSGPAGSWNPATNEVKGGRALYVVYLPFATTESTGVSSTPGKGTPWIMSPGTPRAHIMFVPDM